MLHTAARQQQHYFGKTGPVNIMWRSHIEQKSKMI
jgi:hypothetical protein